MFVSEIYGKTIKAYDMSQIERLASRIANKHDNRVDSIRRHVVKQRRLYEKIRR